MFWGGFSLSRTSVVRMHRVGGKRSFCMKFYVMETNSRTGSLVRILAEGFISGLWPFQTRRLFIHSFTILQNVHPREVVVRNATTPSHLDSLFGERQVAEMARRRAGSPVDRVSLKHAVLTRRLLSESGLAKVNELSAAPADDWISWRPMGIIAMDARFLGTKGERLAQQGRLHDSGFIWRANGQLE